MDKPYFTLVQAITLALYKYGKAKTGYNFAPEFFTVIFYLVTENYYFCLQLQYLQEQYSIHGITVDEHQIINSIISHPPSGYENVGINYRCHSTIYTLHRVLDHIVATQEQLLLKYCSPYTQIYF